MVSFGLGQSLADVTDFARYLRGLNLGTEEQTLSDRLSLAQNAYKHILEYVKLSAPGPSSDQQSSSSLPQPQVPSSVCPDIVGPSPAVGDLSLDGLGSGVPPADESSQEVSLSLVEGQESGGGAV